MASATAFLDEDAPAAPAAPAQSASSFLDDAGASNDAVPTSFRTTPVPAGPPAPGSEYPAQPKLPAQTADVGPALPEAPRVLTAEDPAFVAEKGNVLLNAHKYREGLDTALKVGAITPQDYTERYQRWPLVEQAAQRQTELQKQAGPYPEAKAAVAGLIQGGASLIAGLTGAAGVAAVAPESAFSSLLLVPAAGAATGTVGHDAAGTLLPESLRAASELHPTIAAVSDLLTLVAPTPVGAVRATKAASMIMEKDGALAATRFLAKPAVAGGVGALTTEGIASASSGENQFNVPDTLAGTALGVAFAGLPLKFKNYDATALADIWQRGGTAAKAGLNPTDVLTPPEREVYGEILNRFDSALRQGASFDPQAFDIYARQVVARTPRGRTDVVGQERTGETPLDITLLDTAGARPGGASASAYLDGEPQPPASQGASSALVQGGAPTVVLGSRGSEFPAVYAFAPTSAIQTSHAGEMLAPNPGYVLTNTRNYSDPGERDKQLDVLNNFDARRHVTDAPDAAVGPSIVGTVIDEDGNTSLQRFGGNSRGYAIANLDPERRGMLRALENKKAGQFGLKPTNEPDAELIRYLGTFDFRQPGERDRAQAMVDALNPSPGRMQSTAERAQIDAATVPAEGLAQVPMEIAPKDAQAFVNALIEQGHVDRNLTSGIAASPGQAQDYTQRLLVNAAFREPAIAEARRDPRAAATTVRGFIDAAVPALLQLRARGGAPIADAITRAFTTTLGYVNTEGDGLGNALERAAQQTEFGPEHEAARAVATAMHTALVTDKRGKILADPTTANARTLFGNLATALAQHDPTENLFGQSESLVDVVKRAATHAAQSKPASPSASTPPTSETGRVTEEPSPTHSYLDAKTVTDPVRRAEFLEERRRLDEDSNSEQFQFPFIKPGEPAAPGGAVRRKRRPGLGSPSISDSEHARLAEGAYILQKITRGTATPEEIQASLVRDQTITSIDARLVQEPALGISFIGARVDTPEDVARLFQGNLRSPFKEVLRVLKIHNGKVQASEILHVGALAESIAEVQEVVRFMQRTPGKGTHVIIVHNHPSGNPTPSTGDLKVRGVMQTGLQQAGYEMLDFMITNGETYYSDRAGGIIPFSRKPAVTRADWELTKRSSLHAVEPGYGFQNIADTLRTTDPDAIHIALLTTRYTITALHRTPADLDLRELTAEIQRVGAMNGAYAAVVSFPSHARILNSGWQGRDAANVLKSSLRSVRGPHLIDANSPTYPSYHAANLLTEVPPNYEPANALHEDPEADAADLAKPTLAPDRLKMQLEGQGRVSIPQVLDAFAGILTAIGGNVPIRVGHFFNKALGIYKPRERVARIGNAGNLATAAHEIAHALQHRAVGDYKSAAIIRVVPASASFELRKLGIALYGTRLPVAGYESEGFSEFIRLYLTDDTAQSAAPHTFDWFTKAFLAKQPPALRGAVERAKSLADLWRAQGAYNRAQAQMPLPPSRAKQLAQQAAGIFTAENWLEEFTPLKELADEYRRQTGRTLAPSANPYELASLRRGSSGAVTLQMVLHGMVDLHGNLAVDATGRPIGSLREILAPLRGLERETWTYLWARRALELLPTGRDPGMTYDDARHLIRTLEAAHPQLPIAAQRIYAWQNAVLDYLQQANPALMRSIDRIKASSDNYVPLGRVIDSATASGFNRRFTANPLKRLHGSGRQVKPIGDQIIANTQKLVAAAHRAQVLASIVRLSKVDGLGHLIEEVPQDRVKQTLNFEQIRQQLENMGLDTSVIDPDEMLDFYTVAETPKDVDPIFPVRLGDRVRWFHVSPELYDLLQGLEPYRLGPLADLFLGVPARIFRLGTTGLRASFGYITNPTRDLQTLMMQSQASDNPARISAAYLAALRDVVVSGLRGQQSPFAALFTRLAIEAGQPFGVEINYTRQAAKGLFQSGFRQLATSPLGYFRALLNFMESVPRIAELHLMAKKIGWTPGTPLSADQATALALAGKRVTTDFSAGGRIAKAFNQAIPFFNANVQGARTATRTAMRRPWAAALKMLALFVAPALALWWRNREQKWYRNLPWRERYMYWNFATEDGNVIQVPKTQEWGQFAVLAEALADSWASQESRPLKEGIEHSLATLNPLDWPVLLRALKEQWQNRIEFFDKPIVPRSQIDLPPGEQVAVYSSGLARTLGQAFPNTLSPRRIDAAIRGTFGGAGSDALSFGDRLAQTLGLAPVTDRRDAEASDIPILGRLFRRGGVNSAQSQAIADFWDVYLGFDARSHSKTNPLSPTETLYFKWLDQRSSGQPGNEHGPGPREQIKTLDAIANATEDAHARQRLYEAMGDIARRALEARPKP